MLLVPNGTMTAKPGRPVQKFCKRGHERLPRTKFCIECRRFRENLKYQSDPEWREKKKARVNAQRRKFREENGFWQAELYRYNRKSRAKPKVES